MKHQHLTVYLHILHNVYLLYFYCYHLWPFTVHLPVPSTSIKNSVQVAEIEASAQFGDLIEFAYPVGYSHWGVYDGDGYVIHFAVAGRKNNSRVSFQNRSFGILTINTPVQIFLITRFRCVRGVQCL